MIENAPGGGTVGKALDVLDRVAAHGRPVRFSELLSDSPYPKGTLYRLLQTLTQTGMLSHDGQAQTYSLGLRLVRLAHAAWAQSSLANVARPLLDDLSREIGQTVHLAQLDHGHVLYVDKRNALTSVEMFSQAGRVGPAYCTGVGKAMLAHLPEDRLAAAIAQQSFHRFTAATHGDAGALRDDLAEIRARGFALDEEEHEAGIICVAVPVLDESGQVLGAISATSTTSRASIEGLVALAPRLGRTARQIAEAARYWRFPEEVRDMKSAKRSGEG